MVMGSAPVTEPFFARITFCGRIRFPFHVHHQSEFGRSVSARMNSSVTLIETLKFLISPSVSFARMKSRTSGCVTSIIAIFAPWRPCCLMTENASL